jgi:hypothetical protein
MGFSTNYLGRLDIEPPLNAAEVDWLTAFADVDRRHFTDPYEVPMNPRAFTIERDAERAAKASAPQPARRRRRSEPVDPFTTLTPGDGSPYPHLDWVPCPTGCCLSWKHSRRGEKSRMAEPWLQYLIDHFLRPGALARTSNRPDFDDFTFDHVVHGTIAAERDDTRELWLISCADNEIETLQLVSPDVMPWDAAGGW